MNIAKNSENIKRVSDVHKTADELELQFSFVRGLVSKLLNDFINDTDQSFNKIRKVDTRSDLLKKEVSQARKNLKTAANSFEDKLESTLDQWKREIKEDFKNPNKYQSKLS